MASARVRPGMAAEFTIAVTSTIVETGNNEGNVKHFIEDFVAPAQRAGAELVLFPEMALSGYMQPEPLAGTQGDAFANAETIPGPSTDRLLRAAREHGIYISWGMIEADTTYLGILYNTQVLVGPEGILGKHRKVAVETFGMFDLARWGISPGREIDVFQLGNGWRVGIDICYEHWVPEIPRVLTLKGADLILTSSAGPLIYKDGWPLVNRVRALENQTGSVYSNLAGEYYGTKFLGTRMAVKPDSTLIHMEGEWNQEGLTYATFKAEDIFLARASFPQLRDRIPEAFRILSAPALNPHLDRS